jgi:uncharacterized protein YjbI with pentapeptide repeats
LANPEHLAILKQGVEVWNQWRARGLVEPDLRGAKLKGRDLVRADLTICDLRGSDLSGADLHEVDLRESYLWNADLTGASLRNARMHRADFRGADMESVALHRADLHQADLSTANLRLAWLYDAFFVDTKLTGVDFSHARMGGTVFSSVDLSEVLGLDAVSHDRPSSLSVDTLRASKGKFSESFWTCPHF